MTRRYVCVDIYSWWILYPFQMDKTPSKKVSWLCYKSASDGEALFLEIWGIALHFHYSKIHSDPAYYYLLGSHLLLNRNTKVIQYELLKAIHIR